MDLLPRNWRAARCLDESIVFLLRPDVALSSFSVRLEIDVSVKALARSFWLHLCWNQLPVDALAILQSYMFTKNIVLLARPLVVVSGGHCWGMESASSINRWWNTCNCIFYLSVEPHTYYWYLEAFGQNIEGSLNSLTNLWNTWKEFYNYNILWEATLHMKILR